MKAGELLMRYVKPDSHMGGMEDATLRKAKADAEIAEKNKLLDKTDDEDDNLVIKLEL